MAHLSRQSYVPIVRSRTKTIVGLLSLGEFVNFDGTETTRALDSGAVVDVEKWTPDTPPRADKNPWFMAMVIDDENFKASAYRGYVDFVDINAVKPAIAFGSPGGSPNLVQVTDGAALEILGKNAIRFA
jgi:hypothetical protein